MISIQVGTVQKMDMVEMQVDGGTDIAHTNHQYKHCYSIYLNRKYYPLPFIFY